MASPMLFILVVCFAEYAASMAIEHKLIKRQVTSGNVPTKEVYRFEYKTPDGSYRSEVGMIFNLGADNEDFVVVGSYGFTESDTQYQTMYTADKNGYRPSVRLKVETKLPSYPLPLPPRPTPTPIPPTRPVPTYVPPLGISAKLCQSLCG